MPCWAVTSSIKLDSHNLYLKEEKYKNRQTDRQTDRPTNRQTNGHDLCVFKKISMFFLLRFTVGSEEFSFSDRDQPVIIVAVMMNCFVKNRIMAKTLFMGNDIFWQTLEIWIDLSPWLSIQNILVANHRWRYYIKRASFSQMLIFKSIK